VRRRDFVAGLGAAAAWPEVSSSQQATVPVVAWLLDARGPNANGLSAFRQGLSEAGFVEGRNVLFEFHHADNRPDRLPGLAADLVRRRVAVITSNNAGTPAAKAATSSIPIVFIVGADPVEAGLVSSINRPGGNVTGVSFVASTVNPKRLELFQELVPKPAIIGVVWDPKMSGLHDLETAARTLDRQIVVANARSESELNDAVASVEKEGARGLFFGNSGFYLSQFRQLVALAARTGLPASYHRREFVDAGGLMSYGANISEIYRRAGLHVGRILKGERPGDLPVELPTKFELVFNRATAKALNLDIPVKLLALADDVLD
jgi:putative tryptophan/tyrosine transport system substrate-binding protein